MLKHLDVRQQGQAELTPHEPASGRIDDESQRGLLCERPVVFHELGLNAPQQALSALRLSTVRERDDDPATLSQHRAELVLGLRKPSCRDGRALGLERMSLSVRERVELGDAAEPHALERFVGPDVGDVGRLPDEVRASLEWRDEIERTHSDLRGSGLGVDEVPTPLGRRVDHRLGDRMQRALREWREHAELFDHVAEELEAERLPSCARKDVDEATSDRDLPALLDALDALVTRENERLSELLEIQLVALREPDRRRAGVRRRHPLGNCTSRREHQPALARES